MLTPQLFRTRTYIGMLLDGLASADAKALTAFGPQDAWDSLLARPLESRTEKTITDPGRVRELWRSFREQGVAYDWGEWNIEAPAVAAPVCDREGRVLASIGVVMPVERSDEESMRAHTEAVERAAAAVSAALSASAG